MATLWNKGYRLDTLVERYTVGEDNIFDALLIPSDCVASMAHARVLEEAGLITTDQCHTIVEALRRIVREYATGSFELRTEDEDCHTAIENRLIAITGELGATIHTGRSRNDQVFTALLLYGRYRLQKMERLTRTLSRTLLQLAERERTTFMVGRTHLQPAMPSTVGLWAAAYAEQCIALHANFEALYSHTNRSPLGAAAGYGVPLPLNRRLGAQLLGFEAPIHTVLGAIQSRGHWEAHFLDCAAHLMIILSRLAEDIILFTLPEFNYMSLPQELCSGSSIMPHKRNPDLLELLRAKARTVTGYAAQSKEITLSLPSGYNRDVQEIKPLLVRGLDVTDSSLEVMEIIVSRIQINRAVMERGVDSAIFSVDRALALVARGTPFRRAYQEVAEYHTEAQRSADGVQSSSTRYTPQELQQFLQARTSLGAPGALQIEDLSTWLRACEHQSTRRHAVWEEALRDLAGDTVAL